MNEKEQKVVKMYRVGEIDVIPADTLYGIIASAKNLHAVKNRDKDKLHTVLSHNTRRL